jgi:hypothetical protein
MTIEATIDAALGEPRHAVDSVMTCAPSTLRARRPLTPANCAWPSPIGAGVAAWVNQWLKKRPLLLVKLNPNGSPSPSGSSGGSHCGTRSRPVRSASETALPKPAFAPAIVRREACRPGAVLMPSFVNIGACVGGTMVDT